MVHRKHPYDHLLPAWNYLHVHWVWGLGLVSGPPKCRRCRDHYPRRRRRDFSACSALTRRWDVVVMLLEYLTRCTYDSSDNPPIQVLFGKEREDYLATISLSKVVAMPGLSDGNLGYKISTSLFLHPFFDVFTNKHGYLRVHSKLNGIATLGMLGTGSVLQAVQVCATSTRMSPVGCAADGPGRETIHTGKPILEEWNCHA
jgi:hypothetical protein